MNSGETREHEGVREWARAQQLSQRGEEGTEGMSEWRMQRQRQLENGKLIKNLHSSFESPKLGEILDEEHFGNIPNPLCQDTGYLLVSFM